jgi:chromosome segregation ATPase
MFGGSEQVKTFKDWLSEGDQLYQQAMQEYQALEAQIEDLEKKLAIKKDEVNQIAGVIGKQPVESQRRLTAELIDNHGSGSVPNSPATIARALTGRGLGGR